MTSSAMRSAHVLEALSACRGTDVCFLPSGGNAGDALINLGAHRLLAAAGLNVRVLDPLNPEGVPRADTVVLSGGGGLVPQWRHAAKMLDAALGQSRRVILLPQTVVGHEELLMRLRPEDLLFLREDASLDRCRRLKLACQIELDHDAAFNVDPQTLGPGDLSTPRSRAFGAWHALRSLVTVNLPAWRTDAESLNDERPLLLNDVSRVGGVRTGTLQESAHTVGEMAALLLRYRQVETDRLHVVIACALLGIQVRAKDNINGKVLGVMRLSLADEMSSGAVGLQASATQ